MPETVGQLLLGDDDEPPKMVPCLRCGKQTAMAMCLYTAIASWNRREAKLGDEHGRMPNLIRSNELVTCDECRIPEREDRMAQSIEANTKTRYYLRELLAGRYTSEVLTWLRAHGLAAYVERALKSAGTSKAHG